MANNASIRFTDTILRGDILPPTTPTTGVAKQPERTTPSDGFDRTEIALMVKPPVVKPPSVNVKPTQTNSVRTRFTPGQSFLNLYGRPEPLPLRGTFNSMFGQEKAIPGSTPGPLERLGNAAINALTGNQPMRPLEKSEQVLRAALDTLLPDRSDNVVESVQHKSWGANSLQRRYDALAERWENNPELRRAFHLEAQKIYDESYGMPEFWDKATELLVRTDPEFAAEATVSRIVAAVKADPEEALEEMKKKIRKMLPSQGDDLIRRVEESNVDPSQVMEWIKKGYKGSDIIKALDRKGGIDHGGNGNNNNRRVTGASPEDDNYKTPLGHLWAQLQKNAHNELPEHDLKPFLKTAAAAILAAVVAAQPVDPTVTETQVMHEIQEAIEDGDISKIPFSHFIEQGRTEPREKKEEQHDKVAENTRTGNPAAGGSPHNDGESDKRERPVERRTDQGVRSSGRQQSR